MSQNRYIEKFKHKTDSELEYILEHRKKYNEQAISASIEILKERKGQSSKLESLESEIILYISKTAPKIVENNPENNIITFLE
jgi:hypothetical protein